MNTPRYRHHCLAGHHSRRGGALVLALVVVGTISTLSAGYLQLSCAITRRQSQDVENLRAFYIAEAGLAEAFQAVRVGRKGRIATREEPARFGDGLLWVDATLLTSGQVQLESTAWCGRGRATLALVVEPAEVPLGFFSDDDLVVDSELLIDGYDPDEGTYHDQVEESRRRLDEEGQSRGQRRRKQDRRWKSGRWLRVTDFGLDGAMDPEGGGDDAYHTGRGGLLGSNGDITFDSLACSAQIFGDVIPGIESEVELETTVVVEGETDPRDEEVELPPVEVPAVTLQGPVDHGEPVPFVISPSTVGYESLIVRADAELIVRGPATVVFGDLELEPGAELTLDTVAGDVAVYITRSIELAPGSVVNTTSRFPEQMTLQVADIPSADGRAPVRLDADAQFYGTVFAPDTEVHIGTDFEIYGSVVARLLDLAPGVRLHFDDSGTETDALPRIVSWKIVSIPTEVRVDRSNLAAVLDVEPKDALELTAAHDLEGINLDVDYLDHSGVLSTYKGPEQDFDWTRVASVVDRGRSWDDDALPVEPAPAVESDTAVDATSWESSGKWHWWDWWQKTWGWKAKGWESKSKRGLSTNRGTGRRVGWRRRR